MMPFIYFLLIILANSEMDTIQLHPKDALFQGWWTKIVDVGDKSFLKSTVLSFINDGWHFCKFIMRISECLLLVEFINLSIGLNTLKYAISALIFYGISGLIFELLYKRGLK